MIRIEFYLDEEKLAERWWPAVPHEGDEIDLPEFPPTDNVYTVGYVSWFDHPDGDRSNVIPLIKIQLSD